MEFRRFAIAFVMLAALAASAQAPSLRQAADQAAISIGTLVRPAQVSDAA